MNEPFPLDDLIADDLLLDRLAGRRPAGDEPVATLLSAVADHADRPLTGRSRRRRAHGRRVFTALAVLTVGVSGAGMAAAVTLPDYLPGAAERARIEKIMEANAASNRPSALLSRLGLPTAAVAELGAHRGLVLVRRTDGQIVLMPAAVVAPGGANRGAVGISRAASSGVPAGLTGTPQAPGSDAGDNGNAYAFGRGEAVALPGGADVAGETGWSGPTEAIGPGTASDATAGEPSTDDGDGVSAAAGPGTASDAAGGEPSTDAGDGASATAGTTPATVTSGKGKVRTTAVPRATRPVPTPSTTPKSSPTESVAIVAPGSTSDAAPPSSSGNTHRSTHGATPEPPGASRGTSRSTASRTTPAPGSVQADSASTQSVSADRASNAASDHASSHASNHPSNLAPNAAEGPASNEAKGPRAAAAAPESSEPASPAESRKPVTALRLAQPTTSSASPGVDQTRPTAGRSAGAAAQPQSDRAGARPVTPRAAPAATVDATQPS